MLTNGSKDDANSADLSPLYHATHSSEERKGEGVT